MTKQSIKDPIYCKANPLYIDILYNNEYINNVICICTNEYV